jgi:aspartate/methionine/tyrosine aminotransferase
MRIKPFQLERYFASREFSSRYILSASDCEAPTLRELLERADPALRSRFMDLPLRYTESRGMPELREEIAGLFDHVKADDLLLVVPEEGIFLAMNCILRPGDHVVCPFPAYESLYQVAEALGCEVSLWRPRESATGWSYLASDLETHARPETRLIIVNIPHNPTGCHVSTREFLAMLESARARDAYVFSDEMYRFLEPSPEMRLPWAADLYEHGVSLAGMSKAFGLPGLRLGWLATRDPSLYGELAAFKDYTTICAGAPSEMLSLMALRDRAAILEAQRSRVAVNRNVLDGFVARHGDLFAARPGAAGSVCFPRVVAEGGAKALCRRVQEDAGIMLLPSTVYDFGDEHVRFGLGREDFREGLAALESYLEG